LGIIIDEPDNVDLQGEMAVLATSRSDAYAFFANIFNQLPDDSFVQSMRSFNLEDWLTSYSEDDFSGIMREGVLLIQDYVNSIQDIPSETVLTELAKDRTRLLRGIMRGYGPPPPYEFVYAGYKEAEAIKENKQVRQAYAAAGVKVLEEVKLSPDYIGVELDFMRYVTQAEAQAWSEGCFEKAHEMLQKQHAFLQDHIVSWMPKYLEEMFKEARLDFYRGIAKLTMGFVLDDNEKVIEYLKEAETNEAETNEAFV